MIAVAPARSGPGNTIGDVPIYEFECGSCGERFEELSPAGTDHAVCPACGEAGAERRLSSFGLSRQPTPNQRRRMEDRRAVDRGGARQRFKQSLGKARERKKQG
jgi:putative FmdB family regulatory protein